MRTRPTNTRLNPWNIIHKLITLLNMILIGVCGMTLSRLPSSDERFVLISLLLLVTYIYASMPRGAFDCPYCEGLRKRNLAIRSLIRIKKVVPHG